MQLTKRLLALALALILVLSLAACGGNKEPSSESTTESTTESTEPTTESTEPTTESTEPTTESTEESTQPEEEALSFGTVEGNTYTNETLKLTCTLGEDWYFLTQEEIAAVSGLAADIYKGKDIADVIATSGSAIDMYAMKEDGSTLNLTLSDTGLSITGLLDEDAIVEAMVPTLEQTYEAAGYEDLVLAQGSIPFAGEAHPTLVMTATMGEMEISITQVFVVVGRYIAAITVSGNQETVDATLACFSAL